MCWCCFSALQCFCRCFRQSARCVEHGRGGSRSHRGAAIAVGGALRRRRLHHDVGHVHRELSARLAALEAGEEEEEEEEGNITGWRLNILHHSIFAWAKSGRAHLAVLRQDHGLRVAEVLLGVMQGALGLAGATAQRYGAQGVGGGGALHALHGLGCCIWWWWGEGGRHTGGMRETG